MIIAISTAADVIGALYASIHACRCIRVYISVTVKKKFAVCSEPVDHPSQTTCQRHLWGGVIFHTAVGSAFWCHFPTACIVRLILSPRLFATIAYWWHRATFRHCQKAGITYNMHDDLWRRRQVLRKISSSPNWNRQPKPFCTTPPHSQPLVHAILMV